MAEETGVPRSSPEGNVVDKLADVGARVLCRRRPIGKRLPIEPLAAGELVSKGPAIKGCRRNADLELDLVDFEIVRRACGAQGGKAEDNLALCRIGRDRARACCGEARC